MAYYHILKERRTNLKLSIQDVSNQTRLAPQYIQAIEEHNLDVFSDDLSFVRYFVHAYSDAIGVNWQAISDEVDVDVNEFAHQRDMALTMAQRRMVEQMASVQKTKKLTKKEKKHFRKISWIILTFILTVVTISYLFELNILFASSCMSLILEGILVSLGKVQELKKIIN